MTILPLPLYYRCLAPAEKGAIQYAYESIVPPYIYVIPVSAMEGYYAAQPDNFDGRLEFWVSMFRFGRTTIDVLGVDIDVYTDPFGFTDQWRLYLATHGSWPTDSCRVRDYSEGLM